MKKKDLSGLRREYMSSSLTRAMAHPDPVIQFSEWFNQAMEAEIPEVNAMTLATVSPEGQPTARVVLLKDFGMDGFVFFTNYQSNKGQHLNHNPRASLVFFWPELQRQVRIEGSVEKVPEGHSDEYFASRPRESQIGAIASAQSQEISNRKYLDELFSCLEGKFKTLTPTRPPDWGGYLLMHQKLEFWQGRLNRLNDRLLYVREGQQWKISRLAP